MDELFDMNCSYESFSKMARFNDLVKSVQHCDLCPRLSGRRKVLSSANGNIDSKVLFVAEAPGRLGAEKTGIPLYGDRTGDNFDMLLGNTGWRREDVFITNAVLCNPVQQNGNNGKPTAEEVNNCSAYLDMVINLVSPDVIVTLGATALCALNMLSPHSIMLRRDVATMVPWRGMKLFPLYHPGPRAMIHRSALKQCSDFVRISEIVHPVTGLMGTNAVFKPTTDSRGGQMKADGVEDFEIISNVDASKVKTEMKADGVDEDIENLFKQIESSIDLLRDYIPPVFAGGVIHTLRKLENQVAELKKKVAVLWIPEPKMGIGDFSINGEEALKMQEEYAKRQKEAK